jgi:transposase
MRPAKEFPAGTAKRMQQLLRQARSVAEQRRIQAVLMRASDALPPAKIAELTGLSIHSVRVIHSRFLREGESCLVGRPGRGGRRHALLSEAQAAALLAAHTPDAEQGRVIVANVFKRDYERLVGHKVANASVYRLLAKAGWRKVTPRPSHPKKDPAAEAAFKKTSRRR